MSDIFSIVIRIEILSILSFNLNLNIGNLNILIWYIVCYFNICIFYK